MARYWVCTPPMEHCQSQMRNISGGHTANIAITQCRVTKKFHRKVVRGLKLKISEMIAKPTLVTVPQRYFSRGISHSGLLGVYTPSSDKHAKPRTILYQVHLKRCIYGGESGCRQIDVFRVLWKLKAVPHRYISHNGYSMEEEGEIPLPPRAVKHWYNIVKA